MANKNLRLILPIVILSLLIMSCGLMQLTKASDVAPGPNSANTNAPDLSDSSKTALPSDNSPASPGSNPGTSDQSQFPMPPDSKILSNTGGILTAQVKMSANDMVAYYRKELTNQGLTEDQTFTRIAKPTFNLEFKGSKNGKMLIVQGSEMGDGSVAFSIRYE